MGAFSYFTTGDGCRLAYRIDGDADAPPLVLSNSIGTSFHMWDGQIEELSRSHRVLRYDTRGHGASDAPAGAYSLDRLGRDVIELLDFLGYERVHVCGLSFGGIIAQWLGIYALERIDRLVLANTSAYLGPPAQWDEQIASVLAADDMNGIADMFLANWLPPRMLTERDGVASALRATLLELDPQGLAGCFAAIRDADLRRPIQLISSPTLVIAGQHDTVTLPEHGELIARTVPGAQLLVLPVVHLSNVERPDEFLRAVLEFLGSGARASERAAVLDDSPTPSDASTAPEA
jgi:3-oxoadipate enol-lactonase